MPESSPRRLVGRFCITAVPFVTERSEPACDTMSALPDPLYTGMRIRCLPCRVSDAQADTLSAVRDIAWGDDLFDGVLVLSGRKLCRWSYGDEGHLPLPTQRFAMVSRPGNLTSLHRGFLSPFVLHQAPTQYQPAAPHFNCRGFCLHMCAGICRLLQL